MGEVDENGRPADPSANLEQVRDILFGERARSFEARIESVERRLLDRVEGLGRELRGQIDHLADALRAELETLSERQSKEREARGEAVARLGSELHGHARSVDRQVAELDERAAAAHRDLRSSVEASLRAAREATEHELDACRKELRGETSEVERRKVERKEMALALAQLASRLSDDISPHAPNGEAHLDS
jgi:hypothetical protein